MLSSWLVFLLSSTQILAYQRIKLNCTLPPYPKNGFYHVEDSVYPAEPGDRLKTFRLKLCCDYGYGSIGADIMTCALDGRIVYTDFECLPYCQKTQSLVTCGAESRCVRAPESSPLTPGAPETPSTITPYSLNNVQQYNYEECGLSDVLPPDEIRRAGTPYVAGGRSVGRDELPWHAGVYKKTLNPYMQICGGTIVSPTVIISAAHCFWSEEEKQLPATDYAVAVGKLYRPWDEPNDKNAQKADVVEIRLSPYFQGHSTNLQEDIALLTVASPFSFTKSVRPVCLDFDVKFDEKQLAADSIGSVAGWGLTSEDGASSPVLKVAELPVIDLQQCFHTSDPTFKAHITNDKICAGWGNGTAVCMGDSGGGFCIPEWSTGNKRYYLRGIVSGAPQNEHLCNVYTWASFTRVSKHERFIMETLQQTSAVASRSLPSEQSSIYFPQD